MVTWEISFGGYFFWSDFFSRDFFCCRDFFLRDFFHCRDFFRRCLFWRYFKKIHFKETFFKEILRHSFWQKLWKDSFHPWEEIFCEKIPFKEIPFEEICNLWHFLFHSSTFIFMVHNAHILILTKLITLDTRTDLHIYIIMCMQRICM